MSEHMSTQDVTWLRGRGYGMGCHEPISVRSNGFEYGRTTYKSKMGAIMFSYRE